jgi:hypothetical protein
MKPREPPIGRLLAEAGLIPEITATPAVTSPAPASRPRAAGSRPPTTSAAAAITTLVSRTAATLAAEASFRAARVRA